MRENARVLPPSNGWHTTVRSPSEIMQEGVYSSRSLEKSRVAVAALILSEIMLFGGLISTFLVFHRESSWPPPDLPTYPVETTLIHTFFLLASGGILLVYWKRRHIQAGFLAWLLGGVFLIGQGIEWVQLIAQGLTFTGDMYGALFYLIVGAHALHVLAGWLWLLFALLRMRRLRQWQGIQEASAWFWMFVVLIWPAIYVTVYGIGSGLLTLP